MKTAALLSLILLLLVVFGCKVECVDVPVKYEPVVLPVRIEKECEDLRLEIEKLKTENAELYERIREARQAEINVYEYECTQWDCD